MVSTVTIYEADFGNFHSFFFVLLVKIMAKSTTKKISSLETSKEKKKTPSSPSNKAKSSRAKPSKSKQAVVQKEENTPDLRVIYSNSKYILLPLGLATDFKTKKPMVIFTDMTTGLVHTIALSLWNRWKLKEVKKVSTEV